MKKELVKLANHLDNIGHRDLADRLDGILKTGKTLGETIGALRSQLASHLDSKGVDHNIDPKSTSSTWDKGLQKGWEQFASNVGIPELATDWQGQAKKRGYTPNIQGMWKFIADYKARGRAGIGAPIDPADEGGGTEVAQVRYTEADKDEYLASIERPEESTAASAGPIEPDDDFGDDESWAEPDLDREVDVAVREHAHQEHFYNVYMRAPETSDNPIGSRSYIRSSQPDIWGKIQEYASEMKKPLPTPPKEASNNKFDKIEKAADLLSGIFSNGEIPLVRR